MTSFHNTRKMIYKLSREGINQQSDPGIIPVNHNGQHGKTPLKVQYGTYILVDNQQLFNWLKVPLNKKEIMPGIVNLANHMTSEAMDLREDPTTTTFLH